jgi:hypothetical protein
MDVRPVGEVVDGPHGAWWSGPDGGTRLADMSTGLAEFRAAREFLLTHREDYDTAYRDAWSNVYAPWNAGATVLVYNYSRFDAATMLEEMGRAGVTSFCAPPTVWRMLIQSDLSALRTPPGKVVGAGEPLNPEVTRVELRGQEQQVRRDGEFRDEDFPELRS